MYRLLRFCVVLTLVCAGATDASGSWRGTAGLRTGVVFTDNLFLTNDDKESGTILRLRPYVTSSREGNKLQARFSYGPNFLYYPGNDDLNDVQHTLGARLDAELIERYLFLDVRANANQALINPRDRVGFNALGNPDAFAQRASFRVTPRLVLPVFGGRFASVRISPGVGYSFTASTADDNDGLRTPTSDTSVRIVSGPIFTNTPWSINWRRQVFDADEDRGIGSFTTRVGYIFSPRYRFDVVLGYDDSNDAFRARDGKTSGARWEAIFRWTPNTRARFEFGGGERYFGDTYRFTGRYRHKRWVLRSTYRLTVENVATELEQQEVVPVRDLFGNPIVDPFGSGDVLTTSVTTAALIDDTFLSHRFTLEAQYSKGRNNGSLRWFLTRREYDQSDLDTRDNQLQLRVGRTLSSRLSANAVVNFWDHSEDNDAAFDYLQDALDFYLQYRVGPRANLNARIGRLNRDADASGGDFSENRASLDFSVTF
jgi:uncharacterized protein (PEP-CTERM system associated)